jgi:hypothetical protein
LRRCRIQSSCPRVVADARATTKGLLHMLEIELFSEGHSWPVEVEHISLGLTTAAVGIEDRREDPFVERLATSAVRGFDTGSKGGAR